MTSQINREDLYKGLGNITQGDWERACRRLGLLCLTKYGKGSHFVVWNEKYDIADIRGLITTIQKKLHKAANQGIFKKILAYGIKEDDIWRALKMLK